jgi:hypothetical protein
LGEQDEKSDFLLDVEEWSKLKPRLVQSLLINCLKIPVGILKTLLVVS